MADSQISVALYLVPIHVRNGAKMKTLMQYAIEDGLVYGTDNCPTSCGTVVTLKEISYNCSLIIEWDVGDCFIAENQSKSPLLLSSVKGEYAGSPHSDQAFTHNIGLSVKPHP